MTRDISYEESFNPTNLGFQKAMYVVYRVLKILKVVLAAIFLYFGIMFLDIPFIVLAAIFVGSAVLFRFIQRSVYFCVDCNFANGKTWLVKVVNYKTRKKIIIFEHNEVEQIGRVGSESFDKIYSNKAIKKIFATPNKYADKAFYVYLRQDGVNYLVIMDCKEEYLAKLVAFTGRRVIEKDYDNDISR